MPQQQRKMKDVLHCAEKQNNYDVNDIESIFKYALGIEGKTLLAILQEANLSEEDIEWVRSKESDKGLPGKIVEAAYFGYELNSRQEADFENVGAELKTTAADFNLRSNRFKSGETVSVTQINFNGPIENDFYSSHLYEKLKTLLVIFYHRDKTLDSKLQYEIIFASLFQPSEEDLAIIKGDYREINEKISRGRAHELSRADGIYLSTAPKARRSTNLILPYYGGERIVKRSYTLKKDYVNIILSGYYSRESLEERLITDIHELDNMSFYEVIQSRFEPYIGDDIWDIMDVLNINAEQTKDTLGFSEIPKGQSNKSTLPTITARMLGLKQLKSEEFKRAGIVAKTVFFNKHGTNKEKFRLGDADFLEIHNASDTYIAIDTDDDGNEYESCFSGWEESELYLQLDSLKYLLVVFQEDEDGDIIFKGSKLWAMSDEDIELAHQDWLDIKMILNDGVQLSVGSDGKTHNNFPGVADARIIHLRPHGDKAFYVGADGISWGNGCINDTNELPDGRRMTRQSYWLNNTFIKNVVKDLLD